MATWTATLWRDDIATVDHSVESPKNLLWQYEGKPRIAAFLDAFLEQIDSIEDLLMQVLTLRSVYTAEGTQLDVIGKLVDQLRGEMTDDEYRLFIAAKIYANKANGRNEEIIGILQRCGIEKTIKIRETYPCYSKIQVTKVEYPYATYQVLLLGKPGGCRMDFVYSDVEDDYTFSTSDDAYTDGSDNDTGLGSFYDATIGGEISGLGES